MALDPRDDPAWWDDKFNADVRLKPDQKFANTMVCNVSHKLSSRHLDLAENIIFKDKLNAQYWHNYLMYLIEKLDVVKYPKRKETLKKLLQFGLDVMDGKVDGNDSNYIKLHMLKASMASGENDALRQYDYMWRHKIGVKNATFYCFWADLELRRGHADRAKSIIKNGIIKKASPASKLTDKMNELELKPDTVDDAEIEFAAPSARRKSLRSKGNPDAALPNTTAKKPSMVIGEDSDESSDENTMALDDLTRKVLSGVSKSGGDDQDSSSMKASAVMGKSVRVTLMSDRDGNVVSRKAVGETRKSKPQIVIGNSDSDESVSDDTAEEKTRGQSKPNHASSASHRITTRTAKKAPDLSDDEGGSTDELTRSSRMLGKPSADNNPCDESVVVFNKYSNGNKRKSSKPSEDQKALSVEEDDSTDKTVQVRRKSLRGAGSRAVEEKPASKPSLKKYVDEKLLNFDPLTYAASRNKNNVTATSLTNNALKTKFVIPNDVPKKAVHVAQIKLPDVSGTDNCDNTVLDDTVCADTVRISPGKMKASASCNSNDDVVEFAMKSRTSITRKRSMENGDSSGDDTGLRDLMSRGNSPISVSKRRSLKQPRLSKSLQNEEGDKENLPIKALEQKISTDMRGVESDNVMAIVTSTTKRKMPQQVDESRHATKRSREAEVLSQGTFGGTLLSDPNRVIMLNGKQYLRLNVLGKGGSSCVYLVLSESGALYAYKRVDVHGSDETADSVLESYENEIKLLNSLKGSSHIIQLVDACVSRDEMSIAMVLEAGDVDLAKVLSKGHYGFTNKAKTPQNGHAHSSQISNPFFLRTVWGEMLEAVDYIHENRIVHGDLKPANFVFVRGHLKLIDFGIAKAMSNDTTNIYRDSQVGTINYMAPEAISPMIDCGGDLDTSCGDMDGKRKMKMRLGRPSDIWSLGCILYQMLYGKTPFSALNTIQKLHAIPNPKYDILFPTHLNTESGACCAPSPKELEDACQSGNPFFKIDIDGIESVKMCLLRDLSKRAAIRGLGGLLNHPFLDLDAARLRWGSTVPESNSDRLKVLTDIQQSLTSHLAETKLNDAEFKACCDIIQTVQKLLPAAAPDVPTPLPHRSSRSTPLGHRGASPSVASNSRTAAVTMLGGPSRKILPRGLKDQIQSVETNNENIENAGPAVRYKLRTLAQSTANKWVRPHLTPEKNDMRSVLDKKFGQLRKFLGSEDEDDNDDNTAWQDSGVIDEFSIM